MSVQESEGAAEDEANTEDSAIAEEGKEPHEAKAEGAADDGASDFKETSVETGGSLGTANAAEDDDDRATAESREQEEKGGESASEDKDDDDNEEQNEEDEENADEGQNEEEQADVEEDAEDKDEARDNFDAEGKITSPGGRIHEATPAHPLDEISDEELVKMVEELQLDTKHLTMENKVFVHFLEKNDPSMLEGMGNVIDTAQVLHERTSGTSRKSTVSQHLSTTRRESSLMYSASSQASITMSELDKMQGPRINLTQKTELVLREMEEIQVYLENFQQKMHLTKGVLRAELEEMNVRESELNEALEVFESAIVIGGVDRITQKIPADKFLRYMQEWLKSATLMIDKIRLRTSSLKVQFQKICRQISEKQEMGENLQEVDFEQLEIENKHLKAGIEQKTQLLWEMKKINGEANLALSTHKNILHKKIEQLNAIKKAIKDQEVRIEKLDQECDKVNDELYDAKDICDEVKDKIDAYKVPDVLEYVRTKATLGAIKKNTKIWIRRRQIKDMALLSCVREMKQVTGVELAQSWWFRKPHKPAISASDESFHFQCENRMEISRLLSGRKSSIFRGKSATQVKSSTRMRSSIQMRSSMQMRPSIQMRSSTQMGSSIKMRSSTQLRPSFQTRFSFQARPSLPVRVESAAETNIASDKKEQKLSSDSDYS